MCECWRRKNEVETVVVDGDGDRERDDLWPDVEKFELVDVGFPEEIEAMIGEADGV